MSIQTKNSEIKDFELCLGNTSKDFTTDNMKEKTGLKGVVIFFVDFNSIVTNDNLDIHKYLMKRIWCRIIFGLIKKIYWIIN